MKQTALVRAIVCHGRVLVPYRRFGTIYRSHLQGSISLGLTVRSVKCKKSPVLIFVAAEA